MIQSLKELQKTYYENKKSKLYFFKGYDLTILKLIHKLHKINSIGFNIDYSPFAKNREKEMITFCQKNDIKLYMKEDMLLHPILEGRTKNKNSNLPYKVFTPF